MLATRELGTWTLGPEAINYLGEEIQQTRPDLILEFGSGISTICLAQFMADRFGADGPLRVVSIEQSVAFAAETNRQLAAWGLGSVARVLHAELGVQAIGGIRSLCYVIPPELDTLLGAERAQMLVIDGPSGDDTVRSGTLPLAYPYLAGRARFVLDDAFRPGELQAGERWRGLPGVRIDGIRLIEKGLLTGWVVQG
jgi:hypothetical protein